MPSKLPTARVSAEVPTEQSVLESFTQPRLLDLARLFGCEIHEPGMTKERLVGRLGRHLQGTLPALLGELGRDELRAVCRRHGLDESSKVRAELAAAILTAAGIDPRASSHPVQPANDGLPREGQVLSARHRQWLVTKVVPGEAEESPLIQLVCLDDDDDVACPGAISAKGANKDVNAETVKNSICDGQANKGSAKEARGMKGGSEGQGSLFS